MSNECPACGEEGAGDAVLAGDQFWCRTAECRVVSFEGGEFAHGDLP